MLFRSNGNKSTLNKFCKKFKVIPFEANLCSVFEFIDIYKFEIIKNFQGGISLSDINNIYYCDAVKMVDNFINEVERIYMQNQLLSS